MNCRLLLVMLAACEQASEQNPLGPGGSNEPAPPPPKVIVDAAVFTPPKAIVDAAVFTPPLDGPVRVLVPVDDDNLGLSKDDIQNTIKGDPKIQKCSDGKTHQGGKVIVKFKIAGDGVVVSANMQHSTLNNPAIEKCVVREVLKLKFKAVGSVANVSYPFLFKAPGGP